MMTTSFVTSFVALFDHRAGDVPTVERIEIPLIQRDYAQGRELPPVTTIRDNFLDVLHSAVTGGEPVGLDFVYGEVTNGTLEPLDGQQRLTTLFLLHWYLSARTGRIGDAHRWARFSYATRPSARMFCARLVRCALPSGVAKPSTWITDQPWYLYVWVHDPTIQSMLVVIDAIHRRFAADDLEAAWMRLVDPEEPAVSFHLLPIGDMGPTEDLYIKMNSRGKPLTEFENFKARFEKVLDGSGRAPELAHKIDGDWADVIWPLRGDDNIVDDEFLRYIRFVLELCEWRRNDIDSGNLPLLRRAEQTFAPDQPGASENLSFLFEAFDTWVGVDTAAFFDSLLRTASASDSEDAKLVLFGPEGTSTTNLFEACCHDFDTPRFGNPRKLLLYSVLLHRIRATKDFPRRLRMIRNLVEASENEIRLDRMPKLLLDVERVVVDGNLESVEAFNQAQRADEIEKQHFLAEHPDLWDALVRLEDHDVLRGSLVAFDLEVDVFEKRARAFREVFAEACLFHELSGALLAVGEYQRQLSDTMYRFGSPGQSSQWRALLTGTSRTNLARTRATLGRLLDLVAASDLPPGDRLRELQNDWLQQKEMERRFDWRYYLVKYGAMREGSSGIYAASEGLGFSLCMLNRKQLNSYYRDPFLLAIARESHTQNAVTGSVDGGWDGPWFTGYASTARWMRLKVSDIQIRCVHEGYALKPPTEAAYQAGFEDVRARYQMMADEDGGYLLEVPHELERGVRLDTRDRVQIGAGLLAEVIKAGFEQLLVPVRMARECRPRHLVCPVPEMSRRL
jgi:hypothetical protein